MERILIVSLLLMLSELNHASATNCPFTNKTGVIDLSGRIINAVNSTTFSETFNCSLYYEYTTTIKLNNCSIVTVDKSSFDNFYQLEILNLSHNQIQSLDNDTFTSLLKLEYLDLGYNRLKKLHAGLLDMYKLKEVYFQHNEITDVEPGIVSGMNANLVYFNMNDNFLTSFEPWPYLTNITAVRGIDRVFDLQRNLITRLTNEMNWTHALIYPFQVHVNLQNNKLLKLDPDDIRRYIPNAEGDVLFAGFVSMNINATRNPYFCDCNAYPFARALRDGIFRWRDIDDYKYECASPQDAYGIDWLHYLPYTKFVCNRTEKCPAGCFCEDRPFNDTFLVDCRGAGLTEMPESIPENTRGKLELFLDNNNIRSLGNTTYLGQIYTLSFSSNALQSLDPNSLKAMTNAAHLDFSFNQLKKISKEIQIFDYSYVQLRGNPLECDCDSMWFKEWMQLGDNNSDTSLTCESNAGTHSYIDLTLDDMNCTHKNLIILGICMGILLLVVLIMGIVMKRCPKGTLVLLSVIFRIHPADNYKVDKTEGKPVDIYLAFDSEDLDVVGWMVTLLDKLRKKKPVYSVLNPERFCEPGSEKDITMKWVGKSKRIIIILSENYFNNARHCFVADAAEQLRAEAAGEEDDSDSDVMDLEKDEDPENRSYDLDEFKDFSKPAAKIIYIIHNQTEELKNKLKEDPWKTRLAHSIVLKADEKMFMSKLRYELPRKGNGIGDGNFTFNTKESDSDNKPTDKYKYTGGKRKGSAGRGRNSVEPDNNSVDYQNERAQNADFNRPMAGASGKGKSNGLGAGLHVSENGSRATTPCIMTCLEDCGIGMPSHSNGVMNGGHVQAFGGDDRYRVPRLLNILQETQTEHIVHV